MSTVDDAFTATFRSIDDALSQRVFTDEVSWAVRDERRRAYCDGLLPEPWRRAVRETVEAMGMASAPYVAHDARVRSAQIDVEGGILVVRVGTKLFDQAPLIPLGAHFVIAHELGHHVNAHLYRDAADRDGRHRPCRRDRERAANYTAGVALARLSASKHMLTGLMALVRRNFPDDQPSVYDRLRALRRGWRAATPS